LVAAGDPFLGCSPTFSAFLDANSWGEEVGEMAILTTVISLGFSLMLRDGLALPC